MKVWLWLDLLSSVPYTWFTDGIQSQSDQSIGDRASASGYLLFIRLLRFGRILRLLRLMKLKSLLIKIEDFIASDSITDAFQFGRLFMMICMGAHWITCWFVFVTSEEQLSNPRTWLYDLKQPVSNSEAYVTALYFTFTCMTTVGYGDVTPTTTNTRIFVTLVMILSCGIFAYTLGSIGSLIAKQNAEATAYREKVITLNQYMRKNNLPSELQFRVRRFLEYIWSRKLADSLNEREILNALSEPLRDEVYAQVNGAIINICPVFMDLDQMFVTQLSKLLVPETFAPGDVLFEQELLGRKMFYIVHGKIEVFHQATNSSFKILHTRHFFGEISFFTNMPRCASTRCVEFADILSLDYSDTEKLLMKFPNTHEQLTVTQKLIEQQKDLAPLHVKCYVCKSLGHVAVRCRRILLNLDHEDIRSKWLHGRNQHSRYLNVEIPPVPNYERADKRVKNMRFSAKNVVGYKRKTKELYRDEPFMLPLIKEYIGKVTEREKGEVATVDSARQSPAGHKRGNKPHYSLIYKDSESSGEEDGVKLERMPPRRKTFRKSLIQKTVSSIDPDGVPKTRSSTGPESLLAHGPLPEEPQTKLIFTPKPMPFIPTLNRKNSKPVKRTWDWSLSLDSESDLDHRETPTHVGDPT